MRKLNKSGHQTTIVSTEYKNESFSLSIRMFARWCQENFFRYMMEHFNIDALADYSIERADETKRVVNPAYRKIDGQVRSKAGKLGRKLRNFAEITLSSIPEPAEMEKYEIKKGELIEQIELLRKDLTALKEERKKTPNHLLLGELPESDRFSQLASTRKHFVDSIKMIAYRAETAMASIVRDFMARSDDARSLLREIYTTEADIIPDEEAGTLTVRLHHLTNRLSDKAAQDLAEHLNNSETIYPGTNLRLNYELVSG